MRAASSRSRAAGVGAGAARRCCRRAGSSRLAATGFRRRRRTTRPGLIGDVLFGKKSSCGPRLAPPRRRARPARQHARPGRGRVAPGSRGSLDPAPAGRRAAAGGRHRRRGPLTLDVGKQFVRWGRSRHHLPDGPLRAARLPERHRYGPASGDRRACRAARRSETFEAVWVPQLTPSRLPLAGPALGPVPPDPSHPAWTTGRTCPRAGSTASRWKHTGSRLERPSRLLRRLQPPAGHRAASRSGGGVDRHRARLSRPSGCTAATSPSRPGG
jgi:hypothetical protein